MFGFLVVAVATGLIGLILEIIFRRPTDRLYHRICESIRHRFISIWERNFQHSAIVTVCILAWHWPPDAAGDHQLTWIDRHAVDVDFSLEWVDLFSKELFISYTLTSEKHCSRVYAKHFCIFNDTKRGTLHIPFYPEVFDDEACRLTICVITKCGRIIGKAQSTSRKPAK